LSGTSTKLEIVTDGDSWVFGCEIMDPAITMAKGAHPGQYDYKEDNDSYRIPKIFPTHLSTLLNANVTNLGYPADDNGSILRRTMTYIADEYLAKGKSVDNLFVIIGWSSPERNSFWYKDENISWAFRLWPQVEHFQAEPQREFWKLYVQYLWHSEEYIPRYVLNVLDFQNFCNVNNIKWMCFNSFYQTPKKNVTEWEDLDIRQELLKIKNKVGNYSYNQTTTGTNRLYKNIDYTGLWNLVDPIRFYKKDQPKNTFKSFIEDPTNNINPVLNGWHPSPESHLAWAHELTRYIKENNLL